MGLHNVFGLARAKKRKEQEIKTIQRLDSCVSPRQVSHCFHPTLQWQSSETDRVNENVLLLSVLIVVVVCMQHCQCAMLPPRFMTMMVQSIHTSCSLKFVLFFHVFFCVTLPAVTVVAQNVEHDVMLITLAVSLSMTVLPATNAFFEQDSVS